MIRRNFSGVWLVAAASMLCVGCGLFYQAGSKIKTSRIKDSLKPGESTLVVHQNFGEPDLRTDVNAHTQIWSYVEHPNSNDLTATLLYTSTKPGDTGKFLDLKFVDGNLVSWTEATHTVPTKQGAGFSYGFGPGGGSAPVSHY